MRKGIGVVCLVLGVLLIVKGYDVANALGAQMKRAFTGAPVDAALKLYLAGIVSGLLGLLLIFWKRK
jgi:hypothetical protein